MDFILTLIVKWIDKDSCVHLYYFTRLFLVHFYNNVFSFFYVYIKAKKNTSKVEGILAVFCAITYTSKRYNMLSVNRFTYCTCVLIKRKIKKILNLRTIKFFIISTICTNAFDVGTDFYFLISPITVLGHFIFLYWSFKIY